MESMIAFINRLPVYDRKPKEQAKKRIYADEASFL